MAVDPAQSQLLAVESGIVPITEFVYLSSGTAARNFELLTTHNITHVLNLSTDCPNYFPDELTYLRIKVADHSSTNAAIFFEKALTFLHECSENEQRVLVHCLFGVSIAPVFVMAYLVKYEGAPLWDAYQHVLSMRPVISPSKNFWDNLIAYELEVRGENSMKMEVRIEKQAEKFTLSQVEGPKVDKTKKKKKKRAGSLMFKDEVVAKAQKVTKDETPQKYTHDKFCW